VGKPTGSSEDAPDVQQYCDDLVAAGPIIGDQEGWKMRTFGSLDAVRAAVGEHLGYSGWLTVEQDRIDAFADATGDQQWIHVDPARAASGPFGGTIAHGYLTLSLVPHLMAQVYEIEGVRMGINYGLNKVRFPSPLPTGRRVRAGVRILSAEDVGGGLQLVNQVTLEREGGDKPICVAETVVRLYA
jgi:acyl dehydratase